MTTTTATPDIVNLTGHNLTLLDDDGTVLLTVPPSGSQLRLPMHHGDRDTVGLRDIWGHDIPLHRISYDDPGCLPARQDGVFYFVPLVVALQVRRSDLIFATRFTRGPGGIVLGCRALCRLDDDMIFDEPGN